jgi:imidazolonepropionase-like amidohydrolase
MQLTATAPTLEGQVQHAAATKIVLAGKLFDPYTLDLLDNQAITICNDSGMILDVAPFPENGGDLASFDGEVIDLRHLTVLPGFVDTHVHFFLHPYAETSWEEQVTKESIVERTIRATLHAKRTLMAGFTAVRDLGTEGAGDADIALRKCLSSPGALIPGPRYFCATRAIAPTGTYGPKSSLYLNQEGIDGVTGVDVADGTQECIKAVRRQIGAGADWIKIYADYAVRSRASEVSRRVGAASMATFDFDELKAMIGTAHAYGVKVAAHATNRSTIIPLINLGVDSIEHAYDMNTPDTTAVKMFETYVGRKTKYVPTLAAYYTMTQGKGEIWDRAVSSFKAALELDLDNISCGGDTGVFAHGSNALELSLMVHLGANWKKVLRWATLGGWECVRSKMWEGEAGETRLAQVGDLKEDPRIVGDNEVPFGAVRRGFIADLIATPGNFATNFESAVSAENIQFVMKGGRVYKRDGLPLV